MVSMGDKNGDEADVAVEKKERCKTRKKDDDESNEFISTFVRIFSSRRIDFVLRGTSIECDSVYE